MGKQSNSNPKDPLPKCFVMMPFDSGGKYDRRFNDTFDPAITEAGFIPYRVDKDPAVTDLVAEIETQIRASDICLADITEDNPNVWYELGFAISAWKPVCLVCAEDRQPQDFPFDIRQRRIEWYRTGSPGDYADLHNRIVERLPALYANATRQRGAEQLAAATGTLGVTELEVEALQSVAQNLDATGASFWLVEQDFDKLGYTKLAARLALESLRRKEMIESATETNYNGEPFQVWKTTENGMEWLLQNLAILNLRKPDAKPRDFKGSFNENDIPF